MINLELTEKEKEGLTQDEIEIAMARKLEILILPHLKRNIRFFYAGGNLKGKAAAYREKQAKEDLEQVLNNENSNSIATVCKPLCDMVAEILKENGINAETISCDTDMFRHTDVLITTKNGNKYIINYLEDMENIQTGMKTPDFANEQYYNRRYKKFEGSTTTDGKSIDGVRFITADRLESIDENLGYKKNNMYMNSVINQIKSEFLNFRRIMAENEWIQKTYDLEKTGEALESANNFKETIYKKYAEMTDDEVLEKKLDWIFNYFNDRMDIKGHTDFVMYYSRLLFKEVLSKEEYSKLKRYDCMVNNNSIPENSKLSDILDMQNEEEKNRKRFCIIKLNDTYYAFSTKPNAFLKLNKKEMDEIRNYANVSESVKPSDLMIYLCDRGNALPLVFHPLGSKILNERANMIDKSLKDEQRIQEIKKISDSIKTTDEPITSILIPYPDGTQKYIYINENDEFVLQEKNKKTIYHYNEENDSFEKEMCENER